MEGTRHCGSSSVSIANNNSNSTARAAALQQGTNSSSFGGQPRSEYDMSSYGAPLHTLTHMDEPSSTTTTRLFSSPNTSFPSWSLQPPPNSTTTPPLHWLLSRCVTPQEEEEEQAAAAAASPQLALPAPPAPALSTCFSGNTTLSIELKPSNDDSGGAPFNHSALKKQRHSLSHSRVGAFRHRHIARCHVDGCKADLSAAKDYHRRHKVCEMHSKATKVMAGGVEQRFCQQCSRFHTLSEFDDSKRSCRKRLAGHNERRRKSSRDPTTVSLAAASGVLSCNGASLLLSQSCYPHLQNPLGSSHFVFGNGEGLTEEAFNGIISSPSWPRLVEEKLAISHNILGQKQDPSLSSHSSAGMMVPQSSSLSPGISNLVGRALSLLSSTSPVEAAATMHSPSHHHALFAPTHHRSSDGSLDISVKKEHEGSDGSTLKEMLLLQGPQAHHYHNYQQQQQYNQNHSHQLKFGAAGGGNLRMMLMHEQQMEDCLNNNSNRVPSYSSSSLLAQPDRHPKAHPIL